MLATALPPPDSSMILNKLPPAMTVETAAATPAKKLGSQNDGGLSLINC